MVPYQWSILAISSILNYTSVLNAYPTNEHLQACKIASKHSLQAAVSIILGFSKENNASSFHGPLPFGIVIVLDKLLFIP